MILTIARALTGPRLRVWLTVTGIATSTLLVVVLSAAFRGVRSAMVAYAGQRPVDLWVAPLGTDNLIRGSFAAHIPLPVLDSLRQIAGVARVDPILKGFLPVRRPGVRDPDRTITLLAIGYRTPDGLGGPPALVAGTVPRGRRDIALDRAAAFRLGARVGDTVVLGHFRTIITGLTRGTNILATQFLFGDFTAAASALGSRQDASLALIQLQAGTRPGPVARLVEQRFPDLRAYTRSEFTRANEREVLAGFLPLLTLVALLGIAAASVLVALLVLTVIDERRGEIALLLAIGVRPVAAGTGVAIHAVQLLLLGLTAGLGAALALATILDHVLPTIPLLLSGWDAVLVVATFGVAGLGAAMIPVLQLRTLDPLEAFRP